MKKILILLLLPFKLLAVNYYVGTGGNDANNGLTDATRWLSISKVNSATYLAADSILFRRGDTFYGGLVLNRSNLIFGAYGTGAKPILTGFSTVTGWTHLGGNIWESAVIPTSNIPNIITMNGIATPMGRYPDATYLTITGATANSQIVSTSLTGSPDWTGAEVCIRKNHWIISRDVITSHASSTINYTGTSGYNSQVGYGFFLQSSLAACTSQDEWFFNNTTDKLYIYSASAPINVKISTIDKGIDVGGFDYINIVNLAIEGMNVFGIGIGKTVSNSIGCTIDSCSIINSGRDAIFGTNNNNLTINNCTINNSFNNGIYMENEGGRTISLTVTNCKVTNTGKYAGMGYANSTGGLGVTYVGIYSLGEKGLIQNNIIDTTGYIGIWFRNDSNVIRSNTINYYAFTKDDGAGIYTHTGYDGVTHHKGRKIVSNIVRNGIGAAAGTIDLLNAAHGIYLDDGSSGVVVDSNTVINTAYSGLYLHNADSIIVTNNTVYAAGLMQLLMVHDMASPVSPLRKITIKNNLFFSTSPTALSSYVSSSNNDLDSMSFPPYKIDSNYYSNPLNTAEGFFVQRYGGYAQTGGIFKEQGNLSLWKSYHPIYDANSITPAISFPTYTINSFVGGDKVTNGLFTANISNFGFFAPTSNTSVSWDGSSKITGTGSYKQVFTTPNRYTRTALIGSGSNSFAIGNEKQYVVRFKIKSDGSAAGAGSLRVYFRMLGSPFTTVSSFYFATYNVAVASYEALIKSPTTTASATLVIEASEDGGVTYTDDISVFEVTTIDVDNSSNMSIDYNASNTPNPVTFSGLSKKDVYGNVYNNSVTLGAWRSIILIPNGNAPLPNPTNKINTIMRFKN